ncbi:MAG: glycogen synthase [Pyrinomonadaceae bacterium]|nr:glycogen synthase [Pyrinomonadaceae bacterium]
MRVAILSAEAVPYSKTGGLADVAGALPKALKKIGLDSVLITPCYLQTKGKYLWSVAIDDLWVDWRGFRYRAKAFYSEANGSPTFLIDAPEFFHRSSIYGFREDYERFAFFSYAALCLIKRLGAPPDIVHLNDWHTGFAAVKLALFRHIDPYWKNTRTVFSIHNLAYQGGFNADELWKLGFGREFEINAFLYNGYASAMKAGIVVSDLLSTVSRRYSLEIQTPEFGHGLDYFLRLRADRLFGIVNGIDYEVWNPETDPLIPANYRLSDLSGKIICKQKLLESFGLPSNLEKPVFASISRLTTQKGIDLIMNVSGEILSTGAYIIALGSGEWQYENFWQQLRDHMPDQVGVYIGYNEELAHKIEAGADIFLMPSRFEPCGLNQMYSLRYATVPIVHAVGGLDDTIEDFDAVNFTGNGFKFREFTSAAFLEKIYEALFFYHDKELWQRIQTNGMKEDNSWENAARKYLKLYLMAKGRNP